MYGKSEYNIIAVPLFGGIGSRSRSLGKTRAKPMIPFGSPEKRIKDYTFDAIQYAKIPYSCGLIQYEEGHFRDKATENGAIGNVFRSTEPTLTDMSYDLISPSDLYPNEKSPRYLHTADAVRKGIVFADKFYGKSETYVILPGDGIMDRKIVEELLNYHRTKSSSNKANEPLVTMALKEFEPDSTDFSKFGIAKIEVDGHITGFQEKPKNEDRISNYVNMAIVVLNRAAVDKLYDMSNIIDISLTMPHFASNGHLYGHVFDSSTLWMDVGNPEDYRTASDQLIDLRRNDDDRLLIDPDMIYNKETDSLVHKDTLKAYHERDKWEPGKQHMMGSFKRCVIGPGLRLIRESSVKDSVAIAHNEFSNSNADHAVFDRYTVVTDSEIVGTPENVIDLGRHVTVRDIDIEPGTSILPNTIIDANYSKAKQFPYIFSNKKIRIGGTFSGDKTFRPKSLVFSMFNPSHRR